MDTEGCAVVIGSTADDCEVGVVGVDGSPLVALDAAVVEVALVVEEVLEDGLGSCTEVAGRIGATGLGTGLGSCTGVAGTIGTIGATGLGTANAVTEIDVVVDVTASAIESAVTDAGPESSSLSVIGAGTKFKPCEMQIVD